MERLINVEPKGRKIQISEKILNKTIYFQWENKEGDRLLITSRGKNALKIMLNLSLHKDCGYVKLKDIALEEEVSEKYLEQIVSYLLKARKVRSSRGTNGGYQLIKAPKDYTVGEIIKCLEGDMALSECIHTDEQICERRERCFCYPLWVRLNFALDEVLEQTTLQDLIDWKKEEGEECDY